MSLSNAGSSDGFSLSAEKRFDAEASGRSLSHSSVMQMHASDANEQITMYNVQRTTNK